MGVGGMVVGWHVVGRHGVGQCGHGSWPGGPHQRCDACDGSECCLQDSIGAPHRGVRWARLTASAALLAGLRQSPTRRSEVGA